MKLYDAALQKYDELDRISTRFFKVMKYSFIIFASSVATYGLVSVYLHNSKSLNMDFIFPVIMILCAEVFVILTIAILYARKVDLFKAKNYKYFIYPKQVIVYFKELSVYQGYICDNLWNEINKIVTKTLNEDDGYSEYRQSMGYKEISDEEKLSNNIFDWMNNNDFEHFITTYMNFKKLRDNLDIEV